MTTVQASAEEAAIVAEILLDTLSDSPYPLDVMYNTWQEGRTVINTEELPFEWYATAALDAMLNNKMWPKGVWLEPYDNSITSVWKEITQEGTTNGCTNQ